MIANSPVPMVAVRGRSEPQPSSSIDFVHLNPGSRRRPRFCLVSLGPSHRHPDTAFLKSDIDTLGVFFERGGEEN